MTVFNNFLSTLSFSYAVYIEDTLQSLFELIVLRQNADSVLASSCVTITRMCRAAHMNSVGQY